MPSVLWWGRCDRSYSRNSIVAGLFSDLGWDVRYFHPLASQSGALEACIRRLAKPDLIWVPCFRQRDIPSASVWSEKWDVPLLVDPLISAYQKEAYERCKWPPGSKRAERRRRYEAGLFSKADVVVADTPAHAAFFEKVLNVDPDRLGTLYVGADRRMFTPRPFPSLKGPFEALFYGSFLHLHGPDVIVEAARQAQDLELNWVLLGDGQLRPETQRAASGMRNVSFEPPIEYSRLPDRIAKAHILLGIFGTTLKADLVIPNKIYQAMASARPVITRRSGAYPRDLEESEAIGWVPAGDPGSLADLARKWLEAPDLLEERGAKARRLYDGLFSVRDLREQLEAIIHRVTGK